MSGGKEDTDKRPAEPRCDRCGRPAAITIGEDQFCEECYQLAGSCCMEFGGDDLWEVPQSEPDSEQASDDFDQRKRRAS